MTAEYAPTVAGPPRAWVRPRAGVVVTVLALAALMVGALVPRLVGIANDTDLGDEGNRGLQLRMMAAGFRPVSEVYASQGPLSLVVFYPLYVLFGSDIVAARLAVVVYGVAGLLATVCLGWAVGGPTAGIAAGLLLALSPIYLEYSRLALVEVPSLAPTLAALVALAAYRAGGRRRWLALSAVLLAVGTLAKPMAAVAVLAAGTLIVAGSDRRRAAGTWARRLADLSIYGAVGLAVVIPVVFLVGPTEVWEQVVGYRLSARTVRGWDLAMNGATIRAELAFEGPGLPLLAVVGLVSLARRRPAEAAAILTWLGGGLVMLLVHSPLWPKHLVYLLPPLALLAGAGGAEAVRGVIAVLERRRPARLAPVALAGCVVYVATLPALIGQLARVAGPRVTTDLERYADDLRMVAAATEPGDFIVMDDAYMAMLSGRLVPPHLTDLSVTRVLARALTGEQAIRETQRYGARVVVIQDDRLGQYPEYVAWVDDHYVEVKSYRGDRHEEYRRVYVAPDVDLAAVRAALALGTQTAIGVQVGPLALHGYGINRQEATPNSRVALTLHWESLVATPPEHQLILRLRGPDGRRVHESTWRIGDGAQQLETWPSGRWLFQTLELVIRDQVPDGTYRLTLALKRPNGAPVAIATAPNSGSRVSGTELELTTLRIRP